MTEEEKRPHTAVPADLEEEIRRLADGGTISCRAAFGIAEARGVGIGEIGRLMDDLGIKITACQLGCFP